MARKVYKSFHERVFSNCIIKGENECWEWTGQKNNGGYGILFFCENGKRTSRTASRCAWIATHGEINGNFHVCHTCDNRGCVNPNHLWLGTDKDNMRDMIRKGRKAKAGGRRSKFSLQEIKMIVEKGYFFAISNTDTPIIYSKETFIRWEESIKNNIPIRTRKDVV